MSDKRDHTYFFVHVLKTAGMTFNQHIARNFWAREIYPHPRFDGDMFDAYINIPKLLSLPPGRSRTVRVYHGHFPYACAEELGEELVTMTLLREPVSRVLSYLKYARRIHDHHRDMSPEQVYDDPRYHHAFLRNHQAKIFSMGPTDEFRDLTEEIPIDERRLEVAKANLRKVDILGLTEHYPEFLRTMTQRYGWEITEAEDKNVNTDEYEPSEAFLDRIRRDNAMDIAFHDFAVKLWTERRGE